MQQSIASVNTYLDSLKLLHEFIPNQTLFKDNNWVLESYDIYHIRNTASEYIRLGQAIQSAYCKNQPAENLWALRQIIGLFHGLRQQVLNEDNISEMLLLKEFAKLYGHFATFV